ncbi:FAR1-related protein [Sesbania bispinosa]|nr:FAR1-related protein [Sesbania bispinosa]
MGILCSHALRIYNIKGVLRIPNQYFLKRWSNARSKIYEHMNGALEEVSTSNLNSMTSDDDASLLYRNAIMKSFYNLVLETQEHKEAQKIMWNLLEIGVERVQQCLSKVNLNPNAATNDRCFNQNEENHHSQIQNPPLAKTKGMSSTRKKGHLEKRKRTATKVDHPSNTMSLNASIAKSALYRPQMASTVMPLVWPQIPQSLHRMQPVRPPPIRPPISNGSQFMNASQLVETVQMTQLSQVQK